MVSIGNTHQTEVGDAKKIEEVPIFTVEIENKIKEHNPGKDIDLQFDLSPAAYEGLFKKDLTFTNIEEMDDARNLLAYIYSLDNDNIEYNVLNSPFTNSILITIADKIILKGSPTTDGKKEEDQEIETTKTETFRFANLKAYTYMVDVLKWMTDQEKYFT